jgi:hypothetical protein
MDLLADVLGFRRPPAETPNPSEKKKARKQLQFEDGTDEPMHGDENADPAKPGKRGRDPPYEREPQEQVLAQLVGAIQQLQRQMEANQADFAAVKAEVPSVVAVQLAPLRERTAATAAVAAKASEEAAAANAQAVATQAAAQKSLVQVQQRLDALEAKLTAARGPPASASAAGAAEGGTAAATPGPPPPPPAAGPFLCAAERGGELQHVMVEGPLVAEGTADEAVRRVLHKAGVVPAFAHARREPSNGNAAGARVHFTLLAGPQQRRGLFRSRQMLFAPRGAVAGPGHLTRLDQQMSWQQVQARGALRASPAFRARCDLERLKPHPSIRWVWEACAVGEEWWTAEYARRVDAAATAAAGPRAGGGAGAGAYPAPAGGGPEAGGGGANQPARGGNSGRVRRVSTCNPGEHAAAGAHADGGPAAAGSPTYSKVAAGAAGRGGGGGAAGSAARGGGAGAGGGGSGGRGQGVPAPAGAGASGRGGGSPGASGSGTSGSGGSDAPTA